ncbi:glycosyltransferase family 4 protein [Thalassospira sp. GO-4]|jgi:glycosyltransferase involved in cell wall biosynthesis|uniref:glycosyltransferase family 4 protein n=1 Tax=Thalassospira sp. GO-4 TaxID=2946605 RepID=UPI0020257123|nr:glycosyltransferase family 4 protein [Thalassospira sp. GO-4]URK17351.1 glycosyltransferase family 4 protein [Thalassospira sp. GO-4]
MQQTLFSSNHPIRVLTPFSGDSIGGSYLSAIALIQEANQQRTVNYEIAIHQPGKLEEKLNQLNLPYKSLNLKWITIVDLSKRKKLTLPFEWSITTLKLFRLLKKERYHAVHVHDGRMALTWALPCKLSRTPLIIHQRTKFAKSNITELTYKSSRMIIAITKFVLDSLPATLHSKCVIIDNPVEVPPRDRGTSRKILEDRFGVRNESFLITIIGTHQHQKRQDFAMRIAQTLKERNIETTFFFMGKYGDNTIEKINKKILKKKIDDICIVAGHVESYDYLPGCDLLLAPAVDEGFGRSLIEAITYNVPVLASASGGHLEILQSDAEDSLFKPDDIDDCLRKIYKHIEGKAKFPKIKDYSNERHCASVIEETLRVTTR